MQCMSAFLGGCPASMLRVASQWAIPAEPEIFSQIVICLFLHADICDITFFCYVRPVTKENVVQHLRQATKCRAEYGPDYDRLREEKQNLKHN